MAHYFGPAARDVFFSQYHNLAKHRIRQGNLNDSSVSNLPPDNASSSVSKASLLPSIPHGLDFAFAPKRPDPITKPLLTAGPSVSASFNLGKDIELNDSAIKEFYEKRKRDKSETASPRTSYLDNCLKEDLKPIASLILRKDITDEINLKHNSMGDAMGVIFAKSLKDIPLCHTLNLCDNALTDVGASAIIDSINYLPSLTALDLSMNKLDGRAATALSDYLKKPTCPIVKLTLQAADIDDTECDRFITSLKCNTRIKELDMSNNKIGISENLNSVVPDFRTGAEALGNFLRSPDCPLETLKLEWNMIRLDGAVTFANAIRHNRSLTYLDVSYNSLGRFGGEMLGDSIIDNKTLITLKASSNALNSTACFTICVGIEENYVIRNVVLDNNVIGVSGAKALLEIPLTVGNRVHVSADRCNTSIVDPDFPFDRHDPGGYRVLHLDNGFERAIAFKILQIVATETSYSLNLKYEPPVIASRISVNPKKGQSHNPRMQEIKLIKGYSSKKVEFMDSQMRDMMSQLKKIARAAMDIDVATKLFNEFDEDGSVRFSSFALY